MPRELVFEAPLLVKLDPKLKQRLKVAAAERQTDMSKMTREAIVRYLDEVELETVGKPGEVADWIEQMRGTATVDLSTDEIMALTRGE